MTNETKNTSNKPSFYAYTVVGEGKRAVFTRIGAVFKHTKSEGFSILLNAHPIGDRIVVLPPKEETPESKQS